MESKYPNPCLSCDKEYCKNGKGQNYKACAEWLTWFRWWWKRFRSVLATAPQKRSPLSKDKFYYSHPDQVRRYAGTHPCKGCRLENDCDTPCGRYLHWYDLRVEIARKKVGL